MALKIKWSKRALYRYKGIIQYLHDNWTEREIENFIKRTNEILESIALQPQGFIASSHINIRKIVVGKQNSLIYRITKTHIYLLTFWDNRQDPGKSNYKF